MATLYIMCGIPGSGKSTWARNHITDLDKYVSRDDVRFSLLQDGEDYFSREDEVWDIFIRTINMHLSSGFNVFADATHINPGSRRKLLNAVRGYDKVEVIYIKTPVSIALERNELRQNTNRYVPSKVIHRMYHQFEEPSFEEGFSTIYTIELDNKIKIWRKDND
jgi:predicted kinase